MTAMSRVKSETGCVASGTCGVECGVSTKCVTADCTTLRSGRGGDSDSDTESSLACTERGEGGFGYDPLFEPDGLGVSVAELTAAQKNELSHRGQAFRRLAEQLA